MEIEKECPQCGEATLKSKERYAHSKNRNLFHSCVGRQFAAKNGVSLPMTGKEKCFGNLTEKLARHFWPTRQLGVKELQQMLKDYSRKMVLKTPEELIQSASPEYFVHLRAEDKDGENGQKDTRDLAQCAYDFMAEPRVLSGTKPYSFYDKMVFFSNPRAPNFILDHRGVKMRNVVIKRYIEKVLASCPKNTFASNVDVGGACSLFRRIIRERTTEELSVWRLFLLFLHKYKIYKS